MKQAVTTLFRVICSPAELLELSTSTAANKVKLKSGSEVKPELKVDKDFKADKKITGSWTYDNGYAKMTYKFNDDGTVEINQSDALNVDGTYLIKNGTIIIKYYYTDEVEMDVAYSVESNELSSLMTFSIQRMTIRQKLQQQ